MSATAKAPPTAIGILGAAGRMGQMIAREILGRSSEARLSACVDHAKSWALGKDIGDILGLGPCGIKVTADKDAAFANSEVLIDFTSPEAAKDHAALAIKHHRALVIGTTGLSAADKAAIEAAAGEVPVLQSANMSLGVNVLLTLVERVAATLGVDYDIEIFEAHHRHKADAPSGTALILADAAAKGRGISRDKAMLPPRHGQTGARPPGGIGMSVFRGGDVVGDHTVTFAGIGERLELSHRASDRALFAKGAVKAALWLAGKPPKLYGMKDVLGL
jgi:4-hydroxy-tetrahydrodipicolinate reductase